MAHFVKLLVPNGKDFVFINPDQVCRIGRPLSDDGIRIDLVNGQSQMVKGELADIVAAIAGSLE